MEKLIVAMLVVASLAGCSKSERSQSRAAKKATYVTPGCAFYGNSLRGDVDALIRQGPIEVDEDEVDAFAQICFDRLGEERRDIAEHARAHTLARARGKEGAAREHALKIAELFEATPDRMTELSRWDPLESTCRHASLSIL